MGEAEGAPDGREVGTAEACQGFNFPDLQPATVNAAESRIASFRFDGSAGQTAKGCLFPRIVAERARAGKRWRTSLRSVCRAARVSEDLHNHADGWGEERQHGRGAHSLRQFSEDGADFQEKIGGFAYISGAIGVGCFCDAYFPGDLRCPAVRKALLGPECAVAGDHAVDARNGDACPARRTNDIGRPRTDDFSFMEMESNGTRRAVD